MRMVCVPVVRPTAIGSNLSVAEDNRAGDRMSAEFVVSIILVFLRGIATFQSISFSSSSCAGPYVRSVALKCPPQLANMISIHGLQFANPGRLCGTKS
jgi:hypothetical protein